MSNEYQCRHRLDSDLCEKCDDCTFPMCNHLLCNFLDMLSFRLSISVTSEDKRVINLCDAMRGIAKWRK